MRRQRCVNVICICLRHATVLLFCMSCDWETVKNLAPGSSSTKPDQTGGDGKGVKQSTMFNYSVYSRLGNNKKCCKRHSAILEPFDGFLFFLCHLFIYLFVFIMLKIGSSNLRIVGDPLVENWFNCFRDQ